jgi:hypothetical protein
MTDLRQQRDIARRLEQTQVIERPPLYLPWSQRMLNPFPLASSGSVWNDLPLPWSVNVLSFYCSVFVVTTNNGTNFWTIDIVASPSNTIVASVTTASIAAGAFARLEDTTITQPASTDVVLSTRLTATLSPGAIYIVPAVALLRTGN